MQTNEQLAQKTRVLVIDDSRVMRMAVQRVLNQEFDIIEAEDGEMGWEKLLSDKQVQVIISDVQMPRLDGYSMICRIRAADEDRVSGVPIIVITGAEDDITRERAFACGANDFITKPIDSAKLLACVRSHASPDEATTDVAETAAAMGEESGIDPLTQLHTRRYLLENGSGILNTAKKNKSTLSVIRLGIDHFNNIRSEFGDEIADQALIWASKILLSKTRKDDVVARTSSAEFALVTVSSGRVEVAVLCERIRTAISAKPFIHEGKSIPVTASIGLVTYGHDRGETLEDLLILAHKRMKNASTAGGDRLSASDDKGTVNPRVEEAVMEQPGMDEALAMLAKKQYGQLEPYALQLALTTIPLLEFCNKKFSLDLEDEIAMLKQRISSET